MARKDTTPAYLLDCENSHIALTLKLKVLLDRLQSAFSLAICRVLNQQNTIRKTKGLNEKGLGQDEIVFSWAPL